MNAGQDCAAARGLPAPSRPGPSALSVALRCEPRTEGGMEPAPIKAAVTFELFQQLDIRVGRIFAVDDVSASRKLVRLRVSFGDHERTILAVLKGERSGPQTLIG